MTYYTKVVFKCNFAPRRRSSKIPFHYEDCAVYYLCKDNILFNSCKNVSKEEKYRNILFLFQCLCLSDENLNIQYFSNY